MADKNNVSSFFFNNESNPEDFYLNNNDAHSDRKVGNLDTKKQTNVQNHPFFTPPVVDGVADAVKFSWNDADLATANSNIAGSGELDFVHKDDVLSNRDGSVSDEEAINEILKTEVVDYNPVANHHDYFADLNVKSTHSYKEHERSPNDPFPSPSVPKQGGNLAELDVLKQRLHDASESFSQISNSIEILSGDIDDVNKDFSDYLNTLGSENGEKDAQSKVAESDSLGATGSSVVDVLEELQKLTRPIKENGAEIKAGTSQEAGEIQHKREAEVNVDLDQATIPVSSVEPTSTGAGGVEAFERVSPSPLQSAEDASPSEAKSPQAVTTEIDAVAETAVQPSLSEENYVESDPVIPSEPLSKTEADLEAKIAEIEPEISSFNELIDSVETQPVPDSGANEPSIPKVAPPQPTPGVGLDYSAILADLKHQAIMQVQSAVQSEMDRLIRAKEKLEAELAVLTRNRNFENNLTDLNEQFSSIVSSKQETAPVADQKDSAVDGAEPAASLSDVATIEAERTSIINATKKIMEGYDEVGQTRVEPVEPNDPVVAAEPIDEVQINEPVVGNEQTKLDDLVSEVGNIKRELAAVIKSEVASAIKEEIADIKSGMHQDKIAEATEQLKAKMLVDSANEKKKLDQLIQKTITHEIGLSLLGDEDEKATDALGEMRQSLRHRQVGNEVEEQSRLYDMDRIRHELKDEILNEFRAWNSNLLNNNERKFHQVQSTEPVLGDWFDTNESSVVGKELDEELPRRTRTSRSANLIFNQEIANLKGRDLILKYVNDVTATKQRKPK